MLSVSLILSEVTSSKRQFIHNINKINKLNQSLETREPSRVHWIGLYEGMEFLGVVLHEKGSKKRWFLDSMGKKYDNVSRTREISFLKV